MSKGSDVWGIASYPVRRCQTAVTIDYRSPRWLPQVGARDKMEGQAARLNLTSHGEVLYVAKLVSDPPKTSWERLGLVVDG